MKIKVLVAEDEAPILRSICATIPRTNPNFEVVAMANNGKKVMEIMEQTPEIQVVFLDINMPIVNGIKVLQFLQEQYPHVMPVILSGYQNFEYAQQALKYGAKAYLLKPLRSVELAEVLDELQGQIVRQNEQQVTRLLRGLPMQPQASFVSGQELFIAAVFIGSFRMRAVGAEQGDAYTRTEQAFRKFLNGTYGWGNYCLATDGRYAAKILVVNEAEQRGAWDMLVTLFETLQKDVFEVPVTIILKEQTIAFAQIAQTHYLMRMLAWRDMQFDASSVLWIAEDATEQNLQPQDRGYETLFACVTEQTTREEALELYKNALYQQVATRTDVLSLTKCFFNAVFSVPTRAHSYFSVEKEMMDVVETTYQKEALLEKIQQLLENDWGEDSTESLTKEKLAELMEQYLHTHIEQSITSDTLEKRFGYTAACLRDIFRAIYHVSPPEYLLQLRIERAKQMLCAGIASKSVAVSVGFTDPLYFSKVFKKQTGVTPSAYKQWVETKETL